MSNLKSFFIKTVDNRIKEIVVYNRKIDDKVQIVITTGYVNSHNSNIQGSVIVNNELASNLLQSVYDKILNFGYKEEYEEVLNKPFTTYKDGTLKPSKISKSISSLEKSKFPIYAQPFYKRYMHFNGTLKDHYGEINNDSNLITLCKKVYEQIDCPFDFIIIEGGIAIADIMLLDSTPFRIRYSIIKNINVPGVIPIDTRFVRNINELRNFYSESIDKRSEGIALLESSSLYIPGFSKSRAFIFCQEVDIETELNTLDEEKINILDVVKLSL